MLLALLWDRRRGNRGKRRPAQLGSRRLHLDGRPDQREFRVRGRGLTGGPPWPDRRTLSFRPARWRGHSSP
jgi:hypothetical protein